MALISNRLLSQFIAVAEELHFGRAAKRLHISQPPLSQAMGRLEAAIGAPLFETTKRSVQLTGAGTVFLDRARSLLRQYDEAIAHTRLASSGSSGVLRLGFVGSVSYGLLPQLIKRSAVTNAHLAFDLRELTSGEQLRELEAGNIDVGIVRLPLAGMGGLHTKVILRERMLAVVPGDHLLATRKRFALSKLRDERFIMFAANRVQSLNAKTVAACHEAGFSPQVAQEGWQMPTMVNLVAAKMGVALLPAQIRHAPHPDVRYCDLSDHNDNLELEVAIAWRKADQRALVERFAEGIDAV